MRRARTTTETGVICARYMCPRTVEAPGACARGSGVEKLRTVPAAAQRPARCAPPPSTNRGSPLLGFAIKDG